MRRTVALMVILGLWGQADSFSRWPHRRNSGQTLRRRLFTSPLITNPGGIDLEVSSIWDPRGGYTLPVALKWTPADWQTELSLGFNTVASLVDLSGGRATLFSDHVNLAATTAFRLTDNLSWGFAPAAAFFLRGGDGVRLGGAVIARYDRGFSTFSGAASWSGATRASPANPSGIFDATTGYGRKIGRFTPYANVQFERASAVPLQYSLFEGMEWQFSPRLSFDFGGQHYALNSGQPEHHFSIGLTLSLK